MKGIAMLFFVLGAIVLVRPVFAENAEDDKKCEVIRVEVIQFEKGATLSEYWYHYLTPKQRKGFGYGFQGFKKRMEMYRGMDADNIPATTKGDIRPVLLPTSSPSGYRADVPQYCTGDSFYEGKIHFKRNKHGFLSDVTESFTPSYMDEDQKQQKVLFDSEAWAMLSVLSEDKQKTDDVPAKTIRSHASFAEDAGLLPSSEKSSSENDASEQTQTKESEHLESDESDTEKPVETDEETGDSENDSFFDSLMNNSGFSVSGPLALVIVFLLFVTLLVQVICKAVTGGRSKTPRDKHGRFKKTS